MARWLGKLILNTVLFILSWMIATRLLEIFYKWGFKAGMQLPASFLQEHFISTSFLAGLIAGWFALDFVSSSLLFLRRPEPSSMVAASGWHDPQSWTWLPFAVWLMVGIAGWADAIQSHSVLSTSNLIPYSNVFAVFRGDACHGIGSRGWADLAVSDCLYPISYTVPCAGAFGYSAVNLIPRHLFARMKRPYAV